MYKRIFAALTGLTMLGAAGAAQAAIVVEDGTGGIGLVDKFAGTFHTLTPGSGGTILDVNVAIELGGNSIQWGDLDIFIVHGGVSVQLLDSDDPSDCCSGTDPFDVVFDDEAGAALGETGAVGSFVPQNGALSDFDGLDLAGVWELQIFEVFCCEDETDLIAWSIIVEVEDITDVPAPVPLGLLGAGLLALGWRRRRLSA